MWCASETGCIDVSVRWSCLRPGAPPRPRQCAGRSGLRRSCPRSPPRVTVCVQMIQFLWRCYISYCECWCWLEWSRRLSTVSSVLVPGNHVARERAVFTPAEHARRLFVSRSNTGLTYEASPLGPLYVIMARAGKFRHRSRCSRDTSSAVIEYR